MSVLRTGDRRISKTPSVPTVSEVVTSYDTDIKHDGGISSNCSGGKERRHWHGW